MPFKQLNKLKLFNVFSQYFDLGTDRETAKKTSQIYSHLTSLCDKRNNFRLKKPTVSDLLYLKKEFALIKSGNADTNEELYNAAIKSYCEQFPYFKDIIDQVTKISPESVKLDLEKQGTDFLASFDDSFWKAKREAVTERQKYTKLKERVEKFHNDDPMYSEAKKDASHQLEMTEKAEQKVYNRFMNKLLSTSSISETKAQDWVKHNVSFTQGAKDVLKTHVFLYPPYSLKDLKRDLAYLYRILNGRLGYLKFEKKRASDRSSSYGKNTIYVVSPFGKGTLFHECGHIQDAWNKISPFVCKNFVETRATEQNLIPLKELCPTCEYRDNEVAYPNNFIDPYVGKVYSDEATEVFSMGLWCFSAPDALCKILDKDLEHVKLVLGICLQRNDGVEEQIEAEKNTPCVSTKPKLPKPEASDWEKALRRKPVIDKKLKQALNSHDGYDKVRFKNFLLGVEYVDPQGSFDDYSKFRWKTVYRSGSVKTELIIAYFLVANERGLLPVKYDSPESLVNDLKQNIYTLRAPNWYDPVKGLPEVISLCQ